MKFISTLLLYLLFSCNEANKFTSDNIDMQFSGRLERIEKISETQIWLYLKNDQDSIIKFHSSIQIDSNDIKKLKKSGANIFISYDTFENEKYGKINEVKTLVPI